MCGIVALVRRDGKSVSATEVVDMRDRLTHRGPDDDGLFIDGRVGLGFRRLEIIDLRSGQQPMANPDRTVHLVFNGEIYNYRELREFLRSHGKPPRTKSDTETIIGLYELFGPGCLEYLRGMFAFALWDSRRQRLFLARDRLGIKPLYVFKTDALVAVASEIKAFQALPEWESQVNEQAIPEYLMYRNLSGTQTLFRNVQKVAPGEFWTVTPESETRQIYWELPRNGHAETGEASEDRLTESLRELLSDVVEEHMVSDVPLGTFNSGGLDSSLVTALVASKRSNGLNTYSVGFDDPAFDESLHAESLASRYGTNHHKLVLAEKDYAESLPEAIWFHDEPLNHPHSVHLMHLSRLARERVTVVLTGEGSDELFGGYTRYRLPWLLDYLPGVPVWVQRAIRGAGGFMPPRSRMRIQTVFPVDGGVSLEGLAAFVHPETIAEVIDPELTGTTSTHRHLTPTGVLPILEDTLRWDQLTYLQSLLNRMDKMSMAAGLEGRVPFLDHRLVEFAAQIPTRFKISRFRTKYLLKRVGSRYLPDSIVSRPKAGFAVPIAQWLKRGEPLDCYVDLLSEPDAKIRSYCRVEKVQAAVNRHRSGHSDESELIWGLINLELWNRSLAGG